MRFVDVVFDGPPSHTSGRFIEVENESGASISFGQWIDRENGMWALRIPVAFEAFHEAREQLSQCADTLIERELELRVLWHAMACPYDHCERCIEDADVVKRIGFRLGPAT